MVPMENYGVKCMSIGFLVDKDSPIVWRGPMVNKLLVGFCLFLSLVRSMVGIYVASLSLFFACSSQV